MANSKNSHRNEASNHCWFNYNLIFTFIVFWLCSISLYTQRFGWCVFRLSSGILCWIREPTRNFKQNPLLNPQKLFSRWFHRFLLTKRLYLLRYISTWTIQREFLGLINLISPSTREIQHATFFWFFFTKWPNEFSGLPLRLGLPASNIEQVLAAIPHKAPTIQSPTSHHENYPS